MKLKLEEMQDIAKRLPIGYYLGTKASVTVEEGMRAYCDVVKHDIHIGMGVLQQAADNIDAKDAEKWDREALLRCILYHEVGHLVLTPGWLVYASVYDADGRYVDDSHVIINIFEDERLECILSRFFMGVDFKAFCRLVNKNRKEEPGSKKLAFFEAVRLRLTTPAISSKVDDAIQALASYCASTGGGWSVRHEYETQVSRLYQLIVPKEEEKPEDGGGDGSSPKDSPERPDKPDGKPEEDKSEDGGTPDGGERKPEDDDKPEKPDGKGEDVEPDAEEKGDGEDEGAEDKGDDGDGGDDDGKDVEEDAEEDGEKSDASGTPDGGEFAGGDDMVESAKTEGDDEGIAPREVAVPPSLLEAAAKRVFVEPTSEVAATLNRFATRLSKRKGAQAAGRWSGLHGRIDTKRDAQDKLRIFRRRSDIGESLMSAVNLTLWVDVSGSFSGSKDALNRILSATAKAMGMAGGKLAVNVVKMGDYARVAPPDEWAVNPNEGNSINMSYHKSWLQTRSKNRRNIDIVVFDGNAKSDDCVKSQKMPDGTAIEKVIWNHPDCHIICDGTNERYFKPLKNAHVTYVCGNYAKRLEAEVIKTLDRIL